MFDPLPQLVAAAMIQVGSLDVALPLEAVSRFVLAREISPLPGTPSSLLGLCVVAGRPAIALDLFALLEQPRRDSWPPALGIVGEAEGTCIVLLGGRLRWLGRLRRVDGDHSDDAPFCGAVEWRGAILPMLSWSELAGAAADQEI